MTPSWASSFSWGVVRLATYVPSRGKPPSLVFASVSLLEPGRPRPLSGPLDPHSIRGGGRLFFRRVVMAASASLEWYRSVGPKDLLTPVPTDPREIIQGDGTPVICNPLAEPTAWPTLGMPNADGFNLDSDHPTTPFGWGDRVHRRLAAEDDGAAYLGDASGLAFLKHRLHIDLARYREYVGGSALIVPDPVLRRVEQFPIPAENPGGHERLGIHLVPRRGIDLTGLRLGITEIRLGLLTHAGEVEVPANGLVVVDAPGRLGTDGYTISHPDHGLLRHVPPLQFMRTIDSHMEGVVRQFGVKVAKSDAGGEPEEHTTVSELETLSRSVVGETFEDPVSARVLRADGRRQAVRLAGHLDQRLLDDRDAALRFMRERVARAHREVFVADPYLGGRQLLQVVHHATRLGVGIRLLTSQRAFMRSSCGARSIEQGAERMEMFRQALALLRTRGFREVEARVMGRKPPLHDRFLVVDGTAWFLGNSLNTLGERLSLVLRVPDPGPVVARLNALMRNARPFVEGVPPTKGRDGPKGSGS